jgi:putative transposase
MTRAELEKWFTIYVAKVYANKFHHGIQTTPLAKYQEGIVGTASRPGIGLPAYSDDVNGSFRRDVNKSERSDAGICNDA